MNEKLKEIFQGKVRREGHILKMCWTWGRPLVLQFLSASSASIRKYDDVFLSNQFKAIAHSALSPEGFDCLRP